MTTPILALWQRGVRLNQAPYSFAPKADKEEHQRLHKVSAIDAMAASVDNLKAEGRYGPSALQEILEGPQKILSARAEWDDRMRKFIVYHLKQGNLFGYGFEPPRRMDSQPVEIPASYWNGRIQWDKADLSSQGLKLIEIRVVSRQLRDTVLNVSNEDRTAPPAAGRPTVGPAIKAAFTALQEAGEIDVDASQQSHYPKVRAWLKQNFPNLSVPAEEISDKTIQKHFSHYFNALRKSSKL
ncbi:hypothetical protein PhaeoP18_02294 [Phaeobacter piscinae]|uniref:Uncharacterized protein n=1 Tax=Phaeobacter piscinae TaxID=1580596 RepID=A0AAN1LB40_9RHOB|nr:hypothetical protein [Phaeobacter piscinae]ATG44238.1 hypothetical protein PhaeoP13_02317 [Phaeobacter piscinae]AUR36550.1 hypothetical protein PhaeoP18_02294 [Phaeobacter piscinae]